MKLLCFQAKRFWWKAFSQTIPGVAPREDEGDVCAAVVIFVHAEERDEDGERRPSVMRQTVKHVKWLANKRGLRNVVLHSFTHLGGKNSAPRFAEAFLDELAERLRQSGYEVWLTPFGHFCEWNLGVYGESMAKVWKEIS